MRYFFAILSLAIAAVLIVLGIGQRTFMAPATSVKHEVAEVSEDSQYVVIPADVFALEKGNPSVVVSGEQVFLALAEERDVSGWLAPNTYDRVGTQQEPAALTTEHVTPEPPSTDESEADVTEDEETAEPEEQNWVRPQGSDLWLSEFSGETSLKVAVSPEPTQAVIITSGETLTTPEQVYVIWAQERNTPLAGPLLATGALFAALGIILYLFAVDHDRRGLGPRRGRRGPFLGLRNRRVKQSKVKTSGVQSASRRGSRLGFTVAALTATGLVLTGCSPSYWPQPAPPEPEVTEPVVDENLAVVPVTDQQIDTILERVVGVANEADEALDAEVLQQRFEGPALAERTANYQIRDAAEGTAALPHLTSDRLRYDLVQSTEKWPRTLFITVESSEDLQSEDPEAEDAQANANEDEEVVDIPEEEQEQSPTLVLLLTQQTPHDNYKVNNVISLRGGIEMPAAAPLDEGTAVLANDIKTLRLTPRDAVETFAQIMQEGVDNAEGAELFALEGDPLLEKFGVNWPAQNCIEGLECRQSVTRTDDRITTLSTGQGGALVVATLSELHDMEIVNERDQVKLSDVEMALGLDGSYSKVTRKWQHNILLYVPNEGSEDPIQVLGSSTQVIGASGTEKEGV